jgi:preprotein translocase subunit YajC
MHWLLLLADADPPQQPPPQAPDLGSMLRGPLLPMLLMIGVLVIMSMRSSARQRREQRDMMAKLKKNDKVLTSAGIVGHVVQIKDDETVIIKSGDDANSRLTILRSTIVRIIDETTPAETKPAS